MVERPEMEPESVGRDGESTFFVERMKEGQEILAEGLLVVGVACMTGVAPDDEPFSDDFMLGLQFEYIDSEDNLHDPASSPILLMPPAAALRMAAMIVDTLDEHQREH